MHRTLRFYLITALAKTAFNQYTTSFFWRRVGLWLNEGQCAAALIFFNPCSAVSVKG